jgi:hypothetical protein
VLDLVVGAGLGELVPLSADSQEWSLWAYLFDVVFFYLLLLLLLLFGFFFSSGSM